MIVKVTIAWMWICMHEARIENLLREYSKELSIDVSQIKFILANFIHIADFISINPFGCENSLESDCSLVFALYDNGVRLYLPWWLDPNQLSVPVRNQIYPIPWHIVQHYVLRVRNQAPAIKR